MCKYTSYYRSIAVINRSKDQYFLKLVDIVGFHISIWYAKLPINVFVNKYIYIYIIHIQVEAATRWRDFNVPT